MEEGYMQMAVTWTLEWDITISSNTAQLGGGIYSDNNTINIDGPSVFERNVADILWWRDLHTKDPFDSHWKQHVSMQIQQGKEGGYML